jgi:hypothetical protein
MFLIFMLYFLYSSSHYYFRVNLDYDGREHVTTCWVSIKLGNDANVSPYEGQSSWVRATNRQNSLCSALVYVILVPNWNTFNSDQTQPKGGQSWLENAKCEELMQLIFFSLATNFKFLHIQVLTIHVFTLTKMSYFFPLGTMCHHVLFPLISK